MNITGAADFGTEYGAGLGETCACNDCQSPADIPVRVRVADGSREGIGTVWACVPHAELLIAQLNRQEG